MPREVARFAWIRLGLNTILVVVVLGVLVVLKVTGVI